MCRLLRVAVIEENWVSARAAHLPDSGPIYQTRQISWTGSDLRMCRRLAGLDRIFQGGGEYTSYEPQVI